MLEALHGQVWDTQGAGPTLRSSESAPFVGVRRRSDGVVGSLLFQHWPRFYFRFEPLLRT